MSKGYQAGGTEFLYPDAGDPAPERGAKVNILTQGGISTTGPWDPSFCIGWAPLNSRSREKEAVVNSVRARSKLHDKMAKNILYGKLGN